VLSGAHFGRGNTFIETTIVAFHGRDVQAGHDFVRGGDELIDLNSENP